MFDGEDFSYWKDRRESFISGYDPDLWDVVSDGYKHPVDAKGNKIDRKSMEKQQKIDYKITTRPEAFC